MGTTKVQRARFRNALLRGLLAFALAFGSFFGGFSVAVTAILFVLFLLEGDSASANFVQFLMVDGYHRLYFAIAATSTIIGALWFFVVLIGNLRFSEGATNRMIDRWTRKMDRSNRRDMNSGDA
jgi:hypothetical protein